MPKSKTHAKRRAKQKGVQHDHSRYVPGCMRCELSKAEVEQINEQAEQAKGAQAKEHREKYSIDDLAGRA